MVAESVGKNWVSIGPRQTGDDCLIVLLYGLRNGFRSAAIGILIEATDLVLYPFGPGNLHRNLDDRWGLNR